MPTRRTFLISGAMTGAALLAGGPAAAAAVPRADRFDCAAPGARLLGGVPLHNATVMQSFAFDDANGCLYVVQLVAGGLQLPGEPEPVSGAVRAKDGDLCLTRLDRTGRETGHMYLLGFGHGVQIGAEPQGRGTFLWTEVDSVTDDDISGWGSRLCRFPFVDGSILTRDSPGLVRHVPVPGADRTTCGTDPVNRRLVMRHRVDGAFRYALYDLNDVRHHRYRPLAEVAQPELAYSFQGYATYGSYLYLLEGTSGAAPGNTHLTCVDWRTGAVVDRQFVSDGAEVEFREPEGMAIQVAGPKEVRLCFGFASGVTGDRRANVYYKDALV
ncbi:teichoic acid biosynthesis protein C [Streptosporangium sp. NBC_01639]|uniref:phage baseplate protein n=1 Tax=Streptosporangium sp. NBC_01639 TaxID=2975948 RepID=UPI00386F01F1|nr:teichoic acid biosynthesis protein C [Streptosporangium sp. NBC_01639]